MSSEGAGKGADCCVDGLPYFYQSEDERRKIIVKAKAGYFDVWAYQVNPQQVSLSDPIDLNKRLDGTTTVRFS